MSTYPVWPWLVGAIAVVIVLFASRARRVVRVNDWERAAVYIDDTFDRMLAPGRHTLWRWSGRLHVARVSMTRQYLSVGPVDAVTVDRLPVRLTATVVVALHDPELSLREPIWSPVNLAVTTGLIRLAAAHSLAELMAHGPELDSELKAALGTEIGAATVEATSLTAVVLPPELRRLMTEVERARLEGQAALERARGEQAALRSLANAARLLKDNPELAQLRLLQTVATAKNATLVIGEGALPAAAATPAKPKR